MLLLVVSLELKIYSTLLMTETFFLGCYSLGSIGSSFKILGRSIC